jgi:hypothetical protein
MVPIVYICAWQAAPLQPEAWFSSMIAAAVPVVSPLPPFLRDQAGEEPYLRERIHGLGRITALAVEHAPIFAGELGIQRADSFRYVLGAVGRGFACGTSISTSVFNA